jgi:hypothetical protein
MPSMNFSTQFRERNLYNGFNNEAIRSLGPTTDQAMADRRCCLIPARASIPQIKEQKHGEHLADGAAHAPQPAKKIACESHGAHKETDAENAGGSVTESSDSPGKPRNISD